MEPLQAQGATRRPSTPGSSPSQQMRQRAGSGGPPAGTADSLLLHLSALALGRCIMTACMPLVSPRRAGHCQAPALRSGNSGQAARDVGGSGRLPVVCVQQCTRERRADQAGRRLRRHRTFDGTRECHGEECDCRVHVKCAGPDRLRSSDSIAMAGGGGATLPWKVRDPVGAPHAAVIEMRRQLPWKQGEPPLFGSGPPPPAPAFHTLHTSGQEVSFRIKLRTPFQKVVGCEQVHCMPSWHHLSMDRWWAAASQPKCNTA